MGICPLCTEFIEDGEFQDVALIFFDEIERNLFRARILERRGDQHLKKYKKSKKKDKNYRKRVKSPPGGA